MRFSLLSLWDDPTGMRPLSAYSTEFESLPCLSVCITRIHDISGLEITYVNSDIHVHTRVACQRPACDHDHSVRSFCRKTCQRQVMFTIIRGQVRADELPK